MLVIDSSLWDVYKIPPLGFDEKVWFHFRAVSSEIRPYVCKQNGLRSLLKIGRAWWSNRTPWHPNFKWVPIGNRFTHRHQVGIALNPTERPYFGQIWRQHHAGLPRCRWSQWFIKAFRKRGGTTWRSQQELSRKYVNIRRKILKGLVYLRGSITWMTTLNRTIGARTRWLHIKISDRAWPQIPP